MDVSFMSSLTWTNFVLNLFVQTVKRPPYFERFEATETALNESLMTIRIDVLVNYQGGIRKAFSYIVPINQEEYEDHDFML